jgi:hypothetical protein
VTFNDTFYIICQLLEQLIILETIDLTANSLLKMTDQTIFFTFHMDRIGQPAKDHSPFKSESEEFICCVRNMPKHGKASRRIDMMHNIHMRLTRIALVIIPIVDISKENQITSECLGFLSPKYLDTGVGLGRSL